MEYAYVFNEMGYYWAEIAKQNSTNRQIEFLQKLLNLDGYILDLACGTGRHSIALADKGYCMIGIDFSTNLLKISKQQLKTIDVLQCDMRFLPFKNKTFSATISIDNSFGYLPSQKDDLQTLAEVRRVLKQNCPLVLDVFNQPNIIAKYQTKTTLPKWREYPSFFLLQQRTLSDHGDWLHDSWTVRNKVSGQKRIFKHTVRLYKPEELQKLLDKTNFEVSHIFGDYEEQKHKSDSNRLIFVANSK
jgi:ubiquinone/menaquinone biosynthesis C-methylase UbiE